MIDEPDPFFSWLERNHEAAMLHAGKRCAFHPEHGLLAVGWSLDDVFDDLGERAKLPGLMFDVFPGHGNITRTSIRIRYAHVPSTQPNWPGGFHARAMKLLSPVCSRQERSPP